MDAGTLANGQSFAFTDGSVRFLGAGLSNTLLFGESAINLTGSDASGWQALYGDGGVRNLGSTSRLLQGDGSVRFVSNGASFRTADGSVRVIGDGTLNTVLLGENGVRFGGDAASGHTASFADGSVRFIRDGVGNWSYERRDAGGAVVASGTPASGESFVFADGSVRFLPDGAANTILFGETTAYLRRRADGTWEALFTDGSVRQLGDGSAPLFGDGSVRFISDGTSNTVIFPGVSAPAGNGPAFFYGDGTAWPASGQAPLGWSRVGDRSGIRDILDGVSNTRLLQEFLVPAGADRLTLGFVDTAGYFTPIGVPGGYGDNTGALDITYELSYVAEPPAAVLLACGLGGTLLLRWLPRRRGAAVPARLC